MDRDQRYPANDPVGIAFQTDETAAPGGPFQDRERLDRARIAGHVARGQRTVQRETRFRLDRTAARLAVEEIGGDHGLCGKAIRQQRIVRRQVRKPLAEVERGSQLLGRRAVRFGKDDVVDHRHGARIRQPLGQRDQFGARPGPLTEPRDGGFVHIDHRHPLLAGQVAGSGALVGIEHRQPHASQRPRLRQLEYHHQRQRDQPRKDRRRIAQAAQAFEHRRASLPAILLRFFAGARELGLRTGWVFGLRTDLRRFVLARRAASCTRCGPVAKRRDGPEDEPAEAGSKSKDSPPLPPPIFLLAPNLLHPAR